MTILVTGGAGFIGANFVMDWLDSSNEPVVTLDALTYAGNLANLESVLNHSRHRFVHGDINNRPLLEQLFSEHHIRAVVHFAAESHVDRSISGPEAFLQTNVMGTFALLECARQAWNGAVNSPDRNIFLHVSTDEVFGSLGSDELPFAETTAYAPNSPYSASKAASDHLVRAWSHTYGLPVITTNCSNNYGPFQFPEKLIPLIILQALSGSPLPVYGDGSNVRDWLYVGDHCAAIRCVLERGRSGETYLVGGDNQTANIDMVHAICDVLDRLHPDTAGSYRRLVSFVTDRPGHDQRYAVDCTKLKSELGWQQKWNVTAGLEATVRWYLNSASWIENIRSGAYRTWLETHYSLRHDKDTTP